MYDFAFLNIQLHLPFNCPVAENIQVIHSWEPSSWLSTTLYTFVSSANTLLDIALSKPLMNIRKRTGPKTDPWGTPLHTLLQLENVYTF